MAGIDMKRDQVKINIPTVAAVYIVDVLGHALALYDQGNLALEKDEVIAIRQAHKAYWVALDKRKNPKWDASTDDETGTSVKTGPER